HGGLRQEAQDAAGGDGLSGTGFADDREHFATGDLKVQLLHRVDVAGVRGEGDVEPLDAEDGSIAHGCSSWAVVFPAAAAVFPAAAAVVPAAAVLPAARAVFDPALRRRRSRGSLRSFIDSPTSVMPSTVTTIAMPGNTLVHQMPLVTS